MRFTCFAVSALVVACCLGGSAYGQKPGGGGRSTSSGTRSSGIDPWSRSLGGAPASTLSLPTTVTVHRAEDEKKLDFKVETVVVLVPAVVTDKKGVPVHHLTQADFRILENGRPQKIASCEEIIALPQRLARTTTPNEFSNLLVGAQEPQALTVIALDTINTPYLDQRYGREQLLKYLAQHLQPTQPVALVLITSRGLEVVQDFTDEPGRLVSVLKKVTGERPITEDDNLTALAQTLDVQYSPLQSANAQGLVHSFLELGDAQVADFNQGNAVATTMQAFLDLAWALSGIRGRKSVIWLTGSFPFALGSPSDVPGGDLSVVYERVFHELNQGNVSLYPVDARGLVDPITDLSSATRPTPSVISARAWLHASTLDTLSMVASMTGGRAFFNTNDLAGAVQRAMEDSAAYYMLSYYLNTSDRRPGWRKLKVSVSQQGTQVRARDGFFVTNATINPPLSRDMDLSYAVSSPFDATGIPLEVRLLGQAANGKRKELGFRVHIPPDGMTVQGKENEFDMDFIAMVAGPQAKLSPRVAQNMRGRVPEAQIANLRATGMGFSKKLDLEPGRYLLRFVVRDNVSGRVGSVSAPVVIN